MTSLKQIEANRLNASKSTGPRTAEGKKQSRHNSWRHGLTAETVITALENAADYLRSKHWLGPSPFTAIKPNTRVISLVLAAASITSRKVSDEYAVPLCRAVALTFLLASGTGLV